MNTERGLTGDAAFTAPPAITGKDIDFSAGSFAQVCKM
jgi:hypothetical protein